MSKKVFFQTVAKQIRLAHKSVFEIGQLFRYKILPELGDNDRHKQIQFCETMIEKHNQDPDFSKTFSLLMHFLFKLICQQT